MPLHRSLGVRRVQLSTLLAVAAAASAGLATFACRAVDAERDTVAGRLEFEGASDYSHIRVRRRGNLRSLLFVRDTGEEALESRIDLRRPAELQYNRGRCVRPRARLAPWRQVAPATGNASKNPYRSKAGSRL